MEGACPRMKKQKVRRPLYWLMPLLFALPFALGGLYVFQQYAPKAFHPKAIVKMGVMEKECAEEMQKFFKSRR